MGIVYKAQDLKLDRLVALKFLPPELTQDPDAKQRLILEAKAASSLQHHNICTIHDIETVTDEPAGQQTGDSGQIFIVMDCYEGETLNRKVKPGGLLVSEALDIALQIAHGLSEAHAHGVIHRDIKPGNVLITKGGVVKILDFGLAKLSGPSMLTKIGSTVGTLAYMAPEQARGLQVTQQSDIWSLGVILYEMLSGKRPFTGEYEPALYYAILEVQPPPITTLKPEVPEGLNNVIQRSLAKDPAERYANIGEMIADLAPLTGRSAGQISIPAGSSSGPLRKWRSYVGVSLGILAVAVAVVLYTRSPEREESIRSLAVLPLRATSGTPDAEPFADGMSEALITELSKVKGLVVKSWTSVRQYKDREKTLPQVARELGADGVIEGSTELRGNQVGIRVRLIRATPEEQLWAEDYIEDFQDVLALERQIARAVVREVRVVLTPEEQERLTTTRPVNAGAQHAYFLGRYHWNKWTMESFQRSLQYFRLAATEDSTCAPAYAGIADVYGTLWYMGMMPFDSVETSWRPAAQKAVELDDKSGEAHISLAATRLAYDWDWRGAEEEMKQGLSLRPGYATGHHWYALLLSAMGRHEEALEEIKQAQELDPRSVIINASAGWFSVHARQYQRAETEFRNALLIDSLCTPALSGLGEIYELTGRDREALEKYLHVVSLTGGSFSTLRGTTVDPVARLRMAFEREGWRGYWSEQLAQVEVSGRQASVSAYHLASMYARLNKYDEAFHWLRQAARERSTNLMLVNVEPTFDGLKSDPQFAALLKTINLDPASGNPTAHDAVNGRP